MEKYERETQDKRLAELINKSENLCSTGDVTRWLDMVPEIATICFTLHRDTHEEIYKEIMQSIVESIDILLCKSMKGAPVEDKESYNILRLKLHNIINNFDKDD